MVSTGSTDEDGRSTDEDGRSINEDGNPARPVRDEDAFDVAAVAGWLREHATLPEGWAVDDLAGTPEVRQFRGGASNLTYLLRYPGRDLILRRPPTGAKAASADWIRNSRPMSWALAALAPVGGRRRIRSRAG